MCVVINQFKLLDFNRSPSSNALCVIRIFPPKPSYSITSETWVMLSPLSIQKVRGERNGESNRVSDVAIDVATAISVDTCNRNVALVYD